jgi:hypothetical protein
VRPLYVGIEGSAHKYTRGLPLLWQVGTPVTGLRSRSEIMNKTCTLQAQSAASQGGRTGNVPHEVRDRDKSNSPDRNFRSRYVTRCHVTLQCAIVSTRMSKTIPICMFAQYPESIFFVANNNLEPFPVQGHKGTLQERGDQSEERHL